MALLDFGSAGSDFQEFLKSPQARAMAASLLKSGGVSSRPINMSEAFGTAFDAGNAAQMQDLQRQQIQGMLDEQKRKAEGAKQFGDLIGKKSSTPEDAGAIFNPEFYKGRGFLGGEFGLPELKLRAAGILGQGGNIKEAVGLLAQENEYGAPVQALDANGKPIFIVPDKKGGFKTLDGIMPIPKKGTSLTVGADGQIEFTQGGFALPGNQAAGTKTTNQLQSDIESSLQSLGRLDAIKDKYQSKYLTYAGQARALSGSVISKITGNPNYDKEFVGGRRQFTNEINQLFNQYRKEITGAAAAIKELEMLKESFLNQDLAPNEFSAAYDQLRSGIERAIRIKQKLLLEGIPLGSKEFGERLDAEFKAGGGAQTAASQSGRAMIKTPDGRTMELPSDKLEEALKLGAQRIS